MMRAAAVFAIFWFCIATLSAGELEIKAVDRDSGEPIAVRMHLKDERGRPVEAGKAPFWKDHFVFEGQITLKLRPGRYSFEVERGPEYRVRTGYFTIERTSKDAKTVDMPRFVNMAEEGWWSGDLHVHRPSEDIELLMKAEDLHVAPLITWWNDRNPWDERELPKDLVTRFDDDRFYSLMAGEDERGGGALLYFGLDRPLPIAGAEREFPSSAEFLRQAHRQAPDLHVDIEKPFWWDFPMWIASEMCDSIGVCHNHLLREGVLDNEAWGRPRDGVLYPGVPGNARWTQAIYFHLLSAGVRLPPSAGSASGVLPNPVGYNRVYVHCGDEFTWDAWWSNLRAGRVIVTNGPLLRPLVNGRLPGHVFHASAGQTVELETAVSLSTRDKIEYLEIIQNGNVAESVRLDDYVQAGGKLPTVKFTESGWMLIRAVANHEKTYRFALTGPYYVEFDSQPRISKESAQFFLDWANERAGQIRLDDPEKQRQVMQFHNAAVRFWQERVESANPE
ncbi:MAG: CehA/McbA family metallohydrolase [Planctomycetes bacterium]|nr:CehA/McbA family metallohydrolase [Planctomycetota bacterium]